MAARVADGPLRDLVFTGRTVLIDEAKTMGLIDEKCPSGMLMDRAMEVAQRMAAIPAGAFALTKEAFYTPILERTRQLAERTPASSTRGCSSTPTTQFARTSIRQSRNKSAI